MKQFFSKAADLIAEWYAFCVMALVLFLAAFSLPGMPGFMSILLYCLPLIVFLGVFGVVRTYYHGDTVMAFLIFITLFYALGIAEVLPRIFINCTSLCMFAAATIILLTDRRKTKKMKKCA